jgi:hypothetical protein
MTNIADNQICAAADELVGFLYGELTEWERRKFERHLQDCAACTVEYAAFGQLRESIVAWRDESLGRSEATVPVPAAARPVVYPRPSALAAIREFLSLSPAWLKGAAVFASLLFFLMAAFAVTHLREKKNNPNLLANNGKIYSQQELDDQLAQLRKQKTEATAIAQAHDPIPQPVTAPGNQGKGQMANAVQKLHRPLSRQERQELAIDLRLSSGGDDDDLDLIGDTINQRP